MQRIIKQIDRIKDYEGREIRGKEELKKESHNHFKKLLIANATNPNHEVFT